MRVVEVIPSLLVHSEQEFADRIEKVKAYVQTVHIDVMDGTLVSDTTWAEPEKVRAMVLPLQFEVDLMVNEPMAVLKSWAEAGAVRVLFHVEAPCDLREAIDEAHRLGLEVGMAINPDTPLEDIEPYLDLVSVVLVMAIAPGASGRPFHPMAIERVQRLRAQMPWLTIEVDGGVNNKNAIALRDAGVDRLVSASYLFAHENIADAVATLAG